MRRTDIINGARELCTALEETSLRELIGGGREDSKRSNSRTLEGIKAYTIRAHRFSPAAKKLVQIFELQMLENPGRWLALLERTALSINARGQIAFALDNLPKIVEMLEPEILARIRREHGEDSPYATMRVLSVSIFESDKVLSTPTRLAQVLESINYFYTACALMQNESPSSLSVIACDSGSDKSFDFLGLAKVMECVERLIGTIWDRAFFFREKQFEERLDLVAKSLPIIEQIDAMLEHKQIEPEMGQVLKRNVFEGTNRFLQSGASIPKIEDTSEYNPRLLLSPVQKLLVAAPEGIAQESYPESEGTDSGRENSSARNKLDLSGLTNDEKRMLLALVEKTRTHNNKPSDTSNEASEDEVNDPSGDGVHEES